MLSPQLRTKVHELWTLLWTAGLSNPLVAIEQITYLLFIRQLEALDQKRVADGKPSIYGKVVDKKKGIREHERCKWSVISSTSNIDVRDAGDHFESCRGISADALLKLAVCKTILAGRPGWEIELSDCTPRSRLETEIAKKWVCGDFVNLVGRRWTDLLHDDPPPPPIPTQTLPRLTRL